MKYDSVKHWLESTNRKTNVVHTIENGKAVKATRQEDGTWKVEKENWSWSR